MISISDLTKEFWIIFLKPAISLVVAKELLNSFALVVIMINF